jgi:hypothetical protein
MAQLRRYEGTVGQPDDRVVSEKAEMRVDLLTGREPVK